MLYMIFDISFSVFFFIIFFFFFFFTFSKQSFLGIFDFWLKHPQITRVVQKTVKTSNLPYYLSHFIKKNPLFDVDLFSWTFDMESPSNGVEPCLVMNRPGVPGTVLQTPMSPIN